MSTDWREGKKPVILITGYLGSGKTYGDRINQLVFIGKGCQKAEIVGQLMGCFDT